MDYEILYLINWMESNRELLNLTEQQLKTFDSEYQQLLVWAEEKLGK